MLPCPLRERRVAALDEQDEAGRRGSPAEQPSGLAQLGRGILAHGAVVGALTGSGTDAEDGLHSVTQGKSALTIPVSGGGTCTSEAGGLTCTLPHDRSRPSRWHARPARGRGRAPRADPRRATTAQRPTGARRPGTTGRHALKRGGEQTIIARPETPNRGK